MILKDDVTAAIRRAFQLGQTYWQQADSESYKENKKADATRDRYNALCIETAEIAARADTRIAELETAMKRQAAAVRMLDMSHVARAETMMQHAQVLHDLSKPDELESLRQANAILTADVERAEAELALAREQIARSDEHHQAAAMAMTENLRAEVTRLAGKLAQLQKESK